MAPLRPQLRVRIFYGIKKDFNFIQKFDFT